MMSGGTYTLGGADDADAAIARVAKAIEVKQHAKVVAAFEAAGMEIANKGSTVVDVTMWSKAERTQFEALMKRLDSVKRGDPAHTSYCATSDGPCTCGDTRWTFSMK